MPRLHSGALNWAFALSLFPNLACTAADAGRSTRAPEGGRSASSSGEPQSVRPGVNEKYFDAQSVDPFVTMFEGETREVVEFRERIVAALELKTGQTVADVGAGTGLFVEALAREVGPQGKLYAVDIVPKFIERLRAKARSLPQVEVHEASPQDLGLASQSLDVVFMCDVYHHIEYPDVYMKSVAKALRPGGRLVMIDFRREEGVTSAGMLKHIRADQATVVGELEAAGFRVTKEVELMKENYFLVLKLAQ